jgi:V8-like Glu-specific endopeptidase
VPLLSLPLHAIEDEAATHIPTSRFSIGPRAVCWWILRSSALALAALGVMGCSAEVDGNSTVETDVPLGTDTKIFGGEDDDDPASLGSVVALKVGMGGTYELCSGALVAPNVVLTARHCVANSITTTVSCDENAQSTNGRHVDGEQNPGAIGVYTGASPKFGQKSQAVGKAIVAPKGDYLCDSDIALVVLDRAIENVEPIAVRLDAGVSPGETVRSVGYGQNDKSMPLGTRFRKTGVAVLAMGSAISKSRTALGSHEFEVGRSICQGDSGGPAISEDTGAVVGVVSRGGDCDDDFGHIYTTTAGWTQLFDQAFALAGGAPIVESEQATGNGSGPRAKPIRSPLAEQPTNAESCSTSRAPARGGASLGILLACAIAARARRPRTPPALGRVSPRNTERSSPNAARLSAECGSSAYRSTTSVHSTMRCFSSQRHRPTRRTKH